MVTERRYWFSWDDCQGRAFEAGHDVRVVPIITPPGSQGTVGLAPESRQPAPVGQFYRPELSRQYDTLLDMRIGWR